MWKQCDIMFSHHSSKERQLLSTNMIYIFSTLCCNTSYWKSSTGSITVASSSTLNETIPFSGIQWHICPTGVKRIYGCQSSLLWISSWTTLPLRNYISFVLWKRVSILVIVHVATSFILWIQLHQEDYILLLQTWSFHFTLLLLSSFVKVILSSSVVVYVKIAHQLPAAAHLNLYTLHHNSQTTTAFNQDYHHTHLNFMQLNNFWLSASTVFLQFLEMWQSWHL